MPLRPRWCCLAAAAVTVAPFSLAACGDDDDSGEGASKPSTLSITTTDLGKKKFRTEAPKSIEGGAVRVSFRNAGKVRHEAQLIRLDGGHTVDEAIKIIGAEKVKLPDWLHAEGGVSAIAPGATGTATVKLPPGTYGIVDAESDDGPPPAAFGAKTTFKVTGDNGGSVPDAAAKIEAKDEGDDEFEWVTSNLKPGKQQVTFDNKSKEIHLVVAAPIRGKATLADVKKSLAEEGRSKGPPPVYFDKIASTSVLDGKRKETTRLTLSKGRNALICFLTDRDGKGKPHFQEGMLKEVDIK